MRKWSTIKAREFVPSASLPELEVRSGIYQRREVFEGVCSGACRGSGRFAVTSIHYVIFHYLASLLSSAPGSSDSKNGNGMRGISFLTTDNWFN